MVDSFKHTSELHCAQFVLKHLKISSESQCLIQFPEYFLVVVFTTENLSRISLYVRYVIL